MCGDLPLTLKTEIIFWGPARTVYLTARPSASWDANKPVLEPKGNGDRQAGRPASGFPGHRDSLLFSVLLASSPPTIHYKTINWMFSKENLSNVDKNLRWQVLIFQWWFKDSPTDLYGAKNISSNIRCTYLIYDQISLLLLLYSISSICLFLAKCPHVSTMWKNDDDNYREVGVTRRSGWYRQP